MTITAYVSDTATPSERALATAVTRVVFGFLIGSLLLLLPALPVWGLWHWVAEGRLGLPGLNPIEVYGGLVLIRLVANAASFDIKVDVAPK